MLIKVVIADITTLDADAIVNAANGGLEQGGGVCGAIFKAAGAPELQAACRPLAPCPTGEARITPGFALPAQWIVHAVGPIWRGGEAGEDTLLDAAYRAAIAAAAEVGARRLAVPALSTGVYGFPPDRAAPIAVNAVLESDGMVDLVTFCCFDRASADRHSAALDARKAPR